MKKKLISGLFLMLWMALLIAAMVYPQGIFPVLAASGVWVACLLTWAVARENICLSQSNTCMLGWGFPLTHVQMRRL
ncbi:TPA: hypothetical protein O3K84_002613 [Escherichia coli]|nr:hypothetical protein [Escherichia coli]